MPLGNTSFAMQPQASQTQVVGGQSVNFGFNSVQPITVANGSGSDQATTLVIINQTIAASGSYTLDLTAIPGGTGAASGSPFGTVSFSSLVLVYITLPGGTIATVGISPGGTNGWTGAFTGTNSITSTAANAAQLYLTNLSAAGFSVGVGNKNLTLTNTSTNVLTPTVVLIGR